MKEVLSNLANFMLVQYCRENQIDCSGTHIVKAKRGYFYCLVVNNNGEQIASITFYKNKPPYIRKMV